MIIIKNENHPTLEGPILLINVFNICKSWFTYCEFKLNFFVINQLFPSFEMVMIKGFLILFWDI